MGGISAYVPTTIRGNESSVTPSQLRLALAHYVLLFTFYVSPSTHHAALFSLSALSVSGFSPTIRSLTNPIEPRSE